MTRAIRDCRACADHGAEMPCRLHRCHACGGSGLVCPVCLGARFVRRDVPYGHPDFGQALRCETCCEVNNVNPNPERERRAIERYLSAYRPDTRTRAEREAERKAAAAASYAEYVRIHGDPRGRRERRGGRVVDTTATVAPLPPEELLRLGRGGGR